MGELGFDVIDSVETSIGNIYLCRRELRSKPDHTIFEVQINGHLLMSSISPVSEQQLSTIGLELHHGKGPLRVLVGGLGLGYTAEAALVDPRVSLVRVVDKMDFVIGWLKKGLLPLSQLLTTDPRSELVQSDVYQDLLGPAKETYDLILVDVDHAPHMMLDPANAPFYTPEGQARVMQHLTPGGVLGVWSAEDNDDFLDVLGQVYPQTCREYINWKHDFECENTNEFHNVLFFARRPENPD